MIEAEIKKLKACGFIREEQLPDCLANIVLVIKKNGKAGDCIDYKDLNDACSKDKLPLPITKVMINNTCSFKRLSFMDVMINNTCSFKRLLFMDGFSRYNQIKIYLDYEKHTSLQTLQGVYCYTVMPFDLKNAGATYQRVMTTIFRDHL